MDSRHHQTQSSWEEPSHAFSEASATDYDWNSNNTGRETSENLYDQYYDTAAYSKRYEPTTNSSLEKNFTGSNSYTGAYKGSTVEKSSVEYPANNSQQENSYPTYADQQEWDNRFYAKLEPHHENISRGNLHHSTPSIDERQSHYFEKHHPSQTGLHLDGNRGMPMDAGSYQHKANEQPSLSKQSFGYENSRSSIKPHDSIEKDPSVHSASFMRSRDPYSEIPQSRENTTFQRPHDRKMIKADRKSGNDPLRQNYGHVKADAQTDSSLEWYGQEQDSSYPEMGDRSRKETNQLREGRSYPGATPPKRSRLDLKRNAYDDRAESTSYYGEGFGDYAAWSSNDADYGGETYSSDDRYDMYSAEGQEQIGEASFEYNTGAVKSQDDKTGFQYNRGAVKSQADKSSFDYNRGAAKSQADKTGFQYNRGAAKSQADKTGFDYNHGAAKSQADKSGFDYNRGAANKTGFQYNRGAAKSQADETGFDYNHGGAKSQVDKSGFDYNRGAANKTGFQYNRGAAKSQADKTGFDYNHGAAKSQADKSGFDYNRGAANKTGFQYNRGAAKSQADETGFDYNHGGAKSQVDKSGFEYNRGAVKSQADKSDFDYTMGAAKCQTDKAGFEYNRGAVKGQADKAGFEYNRGAVKNQVDSTGFEYSRGAVKIHGGETSHDMLASDDFKLPTEDSYTWDNRRNRTTGVYRKGRDETSSHLDNKPHLSSVSGRNNYPSQFSDSRQHNQPSSNNNHSLSYPKRKFEQTPVDSYRKPPLQPPSNATGHGYSSDSYNNSYNREVPPSNPVVIDYHHVSSDSQIKPHPPVAGHKSSKSSKIDQHEPVFSTNISRQSSFDKDRNLNKSQSSADRQNNAQNSFERQHKFNAPRGKSWPHPASNKSSTTDHYKHLPSANQIKPLLSFDADQPSSVVSNRTESRIPASKPFNSKMKFETQNKTSEAKCFEKKSDLQVKPLLSLDVSKPASGVINQTKPRSTATKDKNPPTSSPSPRKLPSQKFSEKPSANPNERAPVINNSSKLSPIVNNSSLDAKEQTIPEFSHRWIFDKNSLGPNVLSHLQNDTACDALVEIIELLKNGSGSIGPAYLMANLRNKQLLCAVAETRNDFLQFISRFPSLFRVNNNTIILLEPNLRWLAEKTSDKKNTEAAKQVVTKSVDAHSKKDTSSKVVTKCVDAHSKKDTSSKVVTKSVDAHSNKDTSSKVVTKSVDAHSNKDISSKVVTKSVDAHSNKDTSSKVVTKSVDALSKTDTSLKGTISQKWQLDSENSFLPEVVKKLTTQSMRKALTLIMEELKKQTSTSTITDVLNKCILHNTLCSDEMKKAVGNPCNAGVLKQFLSKFPSIFRINCDNVSLIDRCLKWSYISNGEVVLKPGRGCVNDVAAIHYFRNRMLKEMKDNDPWVPFTVFQSFLNSTNSDISLFVGKIQECWVSWLLRHSFLFKVVLKERKVALREALVSCRDETTKQTSESMNVNDYEIFILTRQLLQMKTQLHVNELYLHYWQLPKFQKYFAPLNQEKFILSIWRSNSFFTIDKKKMVSINGSSMPIVFISGISSPYDGNNREYIGHGQIKSIDGFKCVIQFGYESMKDEVCIEQSLFGKRVKSLKSWFKVGDWLSFSALFVSRGKHQPQQKDTKWSVKRVWTHNETFEQLQKKFEISS